MEISTITRGVKRKAAEKTPCQYACGQQFSRKSTRVKHEAGCANRQPTPPRVILCQDALTWLAGLTAPLPNVVTGIPDINELNPEVDYLAFFTQAAGLIFDRMSAEGYAIFCQTDRKINRSWVSKSTLLINLATARGFKLCWHKIVLNRDVGATDLFRPTYSHLLCFTKTGTSGAATPDVIPVSRRIYNNATPVAAVVRAVEFLQRYTRTGHVIVDPFVGQGTVPAVAAWYNFQTIGVDIDPVQAEKARTAEILPGPRTAAII